MVIKSFILDSGNEEGWFWGIETHIKENGEMRKKYSIRYQNQRAENMRENCRNWRNNHQEQMKTIRMKWRKAHPENIKAMKQRNYQRHREHNNRKSKEWAKDNPQKRTEIQVRWQRRNPEYIAMKNHKRRKLGFIELNTSFEEAHAHHLDKELVVYIPKDLHQAIPHNVWTGEGMSEINGKALVFCGSEKIK